MPTPIAKIRLLGAAALVLTLTGCGGGPFEGCMSNGCDHFRDAVTAVEQGAAKGQLRDALRRGGGFDHPGLDEYGGSAEKLTQIRTLRAGFDALGHLVRLSPFDEPSRPLRSSDHQDIDAAIAMCGMNY